MNDSMAPDTGNDHRLRDIPRATPETVPQGVTRRRLHFKVAGLVIVALVVLIVVCCVVWLTLVSNNRDNKSEAPKLSPSYNYQQASAGLNQNIKNGEDVNMLVDNYGEYYDATIKEVLQSDPSKWDKGMIDKAYLCLLYSDRIGAYSQSQSVAESIEQARKAGLPVDKNSAGVSASEVQAILNRAFEYVIKGSH